MLRFAIIGAGRIGAVHARSITAHSGAELVLVADPDGAAAAAIAAAAGPDVRHTTTIDDVFTDDAVDAVIVGSPTRFHVPQIIAAINAGKAVLAEKPVDLDLARVDECLAAVGDQAHRVMIGFNRRFDPAFSQVQRRVVAGDIGELQQLTVISRDPAAPPAAYLTGSGGIFRDMTIHDFDMVRFLLGEIVSVHAVGQNVAADIKEIGDFDQAVVTLRAASGAVATIINSRHCATGYDQRLEAFGQLGSFEVGNITDTTLRHNTATVSGASEPYLAFFLERYERAYTGELDHFITSIEAGVAPSPSLADGRAALVLADAATESANSGLAVAIA